MNSKVVANYILDKDNEIKILLGILFQGKNMKKNNQEIVFLSCHARKPTGISVTEIHMCSRTIFKLTRGPWATSLT
jgi:hypothetical protein